MKRYILQIFVLLCVAAQVESTQLKKPSKKIAVTCIPCDGRLGNQLVNYVHVKWLSYKYGFQLLFLPFEYSDKFALHDYEVNFLSDHMHEYKNCIKMDRTTKIQELAESTLIKVPFFRDEPNNCLHHKKRKMFETDWNDPVFHNLIRKLLSPRVPIKTLKLPRNKFKLLVHIRKGGGYDSDAIKLRFPYKFLPDSFFIEGIKKASELLNHKPIYAFIMSDDQNPKDIVEQYKIALKDYTNVEFDYRHQTTEPDENVLEDFFSIPNFDGCIRGDSTFTLIAAYLGNMILVIAPQECHIENAQTVVDKVEIQFKRPID